MTNSEEKTEITREFEGYKKESERLIDSCKRMMDKRSKKEEYEELEQPQGVPDVKPISREELDEKIKEVWITPKEAQNIGENTIPLQYSREISRYEPPIPVKNDVKENVKGNETLNKGLGGKKSQEEKEEPLKRAKENLVSPKSNEITPKELEKDSDVKRGHPKEGNGVDKNTEQWVNDQKSFGKRRGKVWKKPYPKYLSHKVLLGYCKGLNNLN